MRQNVIETIVGFGVVVTALWFLFYALNTNRMNTDTEGYEIKARFQNAEGIYTGSDVMVAGIKIGEVVDMILDRENFYAVMRLQINKGVQLPKDSQASIVSSGFLGSKFVSISPGIEEDDLKDGDNVSLTHSSVNLESLLGKFMYSFSSKW
ncbi:MAG UNVERIFIED_CONTAM: outer membrane lipid asymmetry maintenance protein MlaD [Rickettsiaceae bacterium]|jgi:phospholipid/cholesterol/gamma-HCH transport system substrate-binding protein